MSRCGKKGVRKGEENKQGTEPASLVCAGKRKKALQLALRTSGAARRSVYRNTSTKSEGKKKIRDCDIPKEGLVKRGETSTIAPARTAEEVVSSTKLWHSLVGGGRTAVGRSVKPPVAKGRENAENARCAVQTFFCEN